MNYEVVHSFDRLEIAARKSLLHKVDFLRLNIVGPQKGLLLVGATQGLSWYDSLQHSRMLASSGWTMLGNQAVRTIRSFLRAEKINIRDISNRFKEHGYGAAHGIVSIFMGKLMICEKEMANTREIHRKSSFEIVRTN